MAIKKVRIKPPGYTDIVHPETSADVVKFSDGSTVEAHKADAAKHRNIIISTSDPTGGADGDIWIKYV